MPYLIMGFIIYFLIVGVLALSAFVLLLPTLIGIFILAIGNLACKSCTKKFAPIWWDVVTVVLMIVSTVLLCKDIFGTADIGSLPFVILGVYGLVSLYVLILPAAIKQHREKKALKMLKKAAEYEGVEIPYMEDTPVKPAEPQRIMTLDELPEKIQKRRRTCKIVAIVCTVITAAGILSLVTESAEISESLPPTIMFAIGAIICWAIAGKKYYTSVKSPEPAYTQPTPVRKVTPTPVVRTTPKVASPQQLVDTLSRVQQQQERKQPQRFVEEPYKYTSSRLARVRKNITVVQDVFRQYGMTFKCNLVEECDTLQLNFELMNTKQLAAAVEKDTDFFIKANVYDARGNLLCIEEKWVEYRELRRGYASDFFYFSSDSMGRAHSIKVYGIDPTDDFDEDFEEDLEDDEFEEDFVDDDFEDEVEDETDALDVPPGFSQIVSAEHQTFFGTDPSPEFVQSVYRNYQGWNEDLRKGLRKDPANPGQKVYDWKVKETWEDYPAPDYDAVHTYCQVAFTENGRTYYYRTRNPELKVGDQVYVPFGYNAPKKIGTIVSMEEVVGHDAPFPLSKTKYIIGKVQ